MINQLISKHVAKAFDGALKDAVSSFVGSRQNVGGDVYYDPELDANVGAVDITYTGRGVFGSYNDLELQATQVDINDVKLTCLQTEVGDKPQIDDSIVTHDGKERIILSVEQDPAQTLWIVQLRGLNVG